MLMNEFLMFVTFVVNGIVLGYMARKHAEIVQEAHKTAMSMGMLRRASTPRDFSILSQTEDALAEVPPEAEVPDPVETFPFVASNEFTDNLRSRI